MDISTQVEITLRNAAYDTWTSTVSGMTFVCFESPTIVGFVQTFDTAATLLQRWRNAQQVVLARHASALRLAGGKAWNVYTVLLTSDTGTAEESREVERIEENFELTRKIARCGIQTTTDVERALLSLLPIARTVDIQEAGYRERLQTELSKLPESIALAFLGDATPSEVALLLSERGL